MDIDTTTDFGARVVRHLEEDIVFWMTTVGPDLTPQPSPVWFIWDGDTALVYSQPGTPKLRNIRERPQVSLNFNGDPHGGDIVVLTGDATIETDALPANEVPAYVEKYARDMERIGMTPDAFATAYSMPIRVRPTALRGH